MIFRPSCAFSPSINVSFASQTFYRNQTYSFTVVSSAASGSYFFECVGWVLAPQNFAAPFSAEFQLFKNASSSYPLNRATTASSNSIVLSSASSSSNTDITIRPTSILAGSSFILSVTGKFPSATLSPSILSAGCSSQHLCITADSGAVYCRGRGDSKQLGRDSYFSSHRFVLVPISNFDSKINSLSIGGTHSCALIGNSRLRCWGNNLFGQLGTALVNTSSGFEVPLPSQSSTNPIAITLGSVHSCVLFQNGNVWCWGDNSRGQLGIGSVGGNTSTATLVPGLTGVLSIALGGYHTCALTGTSSMYCWGSNSFGQAGVLGIQVVVSPTLIFTKNGTKYSRLACGLDFSCALVTSSTPSSIDCVGSNYFGQLGGVGFYSTPSLESTVLSSCSNPSICNQNSGLTCVQTSPTQVEVYGRMLFSCSPTNLDFFLNNARYVSPVIRVTSMMASVSLASMLNRDGTGYFTINALGQFPNLRSVYSGYFHVCSYLSNNALVCWGSNSNGQLGIGSVGGNTSTATLVPGLTGVLSIALGGYHTCALTGTSSMYCWGSNSFGQLGFAAGVGSDVGSPQVVTGISMASGGSAVVSIALGLAHSCVLFQNGNVWCWGDNSRGQLGIGSVGSWFSAPQRVSALSTRATSLTVGAYHACIVSISNDTVCFGYNQYGQV